MASRNKKIFVVFLAFSCDFDVICAHMLFKTAKTYTVEVRTIRRIIRNLQEGDIFVQI